MKNAEIKNLGRCAEVSSNLSSRYVMTITSKTIAGPRFIAFDTLDGLVHAMQIVAWAMGKEVTTTPEEVEEGLELESSETTVEAFAYPF